MVVLLPDGQRIVLTNLTQYSASGAVVTFYTAGGSAGAPTTVTSTLASAANAAYLLLQIDAIISTAGNQVVFLNGSPAALQMATPSAFNPLTDGITIYGCGFSQATLGTVYVLDAGGGLTGYSFTPTFVSSNKLTAVPLAAGTGTVADTKLVYVDSSGRISNVALVTLTGAPALTFTSIVGGPLVGGTFPAGAFINGTGFALAGIDALKADDGLGNVTLMPFTYINDGLLSISIATVFFFPTTFTIYYSINGGVTWTTTGLTLAST